MTLKTEIDKSNKLKEDLKLARNKINERILSGGGTIANTISEVPKCIEGMLGQYKKVAILDYKNKPIPISKGAIKWNLSFVPKTLIICVELFADNLHEHDTFNVIPNPVLNDKRKLSWVRQTSSEYWEGTVKTFNESTLSWRDDYVFGNVNKDLVGISYVIAIG